MSSLSPPSILEIRDGLTFAKPTKSELELAFKVRLVFEENAVGMGDFSIFDAFPFLLISEEEKHGNIIDCVIETEKKWKTGKKGRKKQKEKRKRL